MGITRQSLVNNIDNEFSFSSRRITIERIVNTGRGGEGRGGGNHEE